MGFLHNIIPTNKLLIELKKEKKKSAVIRARLVMNDLWWRSTEIRTI